MEGLDLRDMGALASSNQTWAQGVLDVLLRLNGSAPLDESVDPVADFTSKVHVFLLPLLILVGVVGNSMAILLVRTHNSLRRLPSNAFLLVLASASLVFLLVLSYQWAESVTGWNYWNEVPLLCKVLTWLGHCCDFASAWLVVLLSIERAVVLFRFHARHRFCNVQAARRLILLLAAITAAFNSWVLFLANITHPSQDDMALIHVSGSEGQRPSPPPLTPSPPEALGPGYCGVRPEDEWAYSVLLGLETILGMVIPAFLIAGTNLMLVCKLQYYRRFLPLSPSVRFHRPSKDALSSPETAYRTDGAISATTTLNGNTTITVLTNGGTQKQIRRVRPSDLRLTRTLLVITSLFIFFNLPSYLFRISDQVGAGALETVEVNLTSMSPEEIKREYEAQQRQLWLSSWLDVFKLIAFLLSYAHHAVLFYVYIFYSPQMKKQLRPMAIKLLECDCLKPVPGMDIADSL